MQYLAICAPCVFALAMARMALPVDASDRPTLPCRIELAKTDDRASLTVMGDKLTVEITSAKGIGKAVLVRCTEKWPQTVVLNLHLSGLEHFGVRAGKTTVHGSVSSNSTDDQRFVQVIGTEETPLKHDDALSPTIRMLDKNGKPAEQVPLKDGYFEITLPVKLWAANPDSIELDWIDWYRG